LELFYIPQPKFDIIVHGYADNFLLLVEHYFVDGWLWNKRGGQRILLLSKFVGFSGREKVPCAAGH
jgi:hypothetical protein